MFRYASLRAPEHAALLSRVLQIQPKRTATTIVSYLTPGELDALLVFAAQTGLRVSELTGLATHDVTLGTGPRRTYAPPPFITDETGRDVITLTTTEVRRLFNLHTLWVPETYATR